MEVLTGGAEPMRSPEKRSADDWQLVNTWLSFPMFDASDALQQEVAEGRMDGALRLQRMAALAARGAAEAVRGAGPVRRGPAEPVASIAANLDHTWLGALVLLELDVKHTLLELGADAFRVDRVRHLERAVVLQR
jgi:hypothetical protein